MIINEFIEGVYKMVPEFLEIKSNDDAICNLGKCGESLTSILKYLLENNTVDKVLTVGKYDDIYYGVPILIENPDDVDKTE